MTTTTSPAVTAAVKACDCPWPGIVIGPGWDGQREPRDGDIAQCPDCIDSPGYVPVPVTEPRRHDFPPENGGQWSMVMCRNGCGRAMSHGYVDDWECLGVEPRPALWATVWCVGDQVRYRGEADDEPLYIWQLRLGDNGPDPTAIVGYSATFNWEVTDLADLTLVVSEDMRPEYDERLRWRP